MVKATKQDSGTLRRAVSGALGIVALFSAVLCAATVSAQQPQTILPEAVALFGESEGAPIRTGIVFVDGRFVRPPYKVSRRGNGIFINGQLFQKLMIAPTPPASEEPDEASAPAPAPAPEPKTASDAGATDEKAADDVPDLKVDVDEKVPDVDAAGYVPEGVDNVRAPTLSGQRSTSLTPMGGSRQAADAKKKQFDPNDLFEDADFTFSLPRRPEPKAVPYVRPAAEKSMKERAEEARAKEAAEAERRKAAAAASAEGGAAVTPSVRPAVEPAGSAESFEGFDQARVEAAQKSMDALCKRYEALLKRGDLVYGGTLSPRGSYIKRVGEPFFKALPELLSITTAADFTAKVQAQGFVAIDSRLTQLIFQHRVFNRSPVTTYVKQMEREARR